MKLNRNFQQPGICKTATTSANEDFSEIKRTIVPQPYSYHRLVDYVGSNFDYREIHVNDSQYAIFKENISRALNRDVLEISPLFLKLPKTEKNIDLYSNLQGYTEVYLYLDKKTCYFETNSVFLHEKLFLVRGVNQEDYDNNSLILQELVSVIKNS